MDADLTAVSVTGSLLVLAAAAALGALVRRDLAGAGPGPGPGAGAGGGLFLGAAMGTG
ncbi:MAG: hypothetical protein H6907_17085, partial [Hyphomicrobiales bacterium]|nr:hypothetical protein [Hyphomicrobiales bacterium]